MRWCGEIARAWAWALLMTASCPSLLTEVDAFIPEMNQGSMKLSTFMSKRPRDTFNSCNAPTIVSKKGPNLPLRWREMQSTPEAAPATALFSAVEDDAGSDLSTGESSDGASNTTANSTAVESVASEQLSSSNGISASDKVEKKEVMYASEKTMGDDGSDLSTGESSDGASNTTANSTAVESVASKQLSSRSGISASDKVEKKEVMHASEKTMGGDPSVSLGVAWKENLPKKESSVAASFAKPRIEENPSEKQIFAPMTSADEDAIIKKLLEEVEADADAAVDQSSIEERPRSASPSTGSRLQQKQSPSVGASTVLFSTTEDTVESDAAAMSGSTVDGTRAAKSPDVSNTDAYLNNITAHESPARDADKRSAHTTADMGSKGAERKEVLVGSEGKVIVPLTSEDEAELIEKLIGNVEADAAINLAVGAAVDDLMDDTCEVDLVTGEPKDLEVCADESTFRRAKDKLKNLIGKTIGVVKSSGDSVDGELEIDIDEVNPELLEGEILEQGWEERGNSSALRRNAEVWKFALKCVFKALKPRKLRKNGASEEEIKEATTEAAIFIRDGLLRLGPTFVKLGQVVSTRTDVLPLEYTEVLKTLQDDVPGFSGKRAKEIVTRELGKPCDKVFKNFSKKPVAAASLGQVHTAKYKGKKVAIKVQRAGLKELFDVDLKNLKKLAELLDKFDPKTDGADRDWVSIYEESERLLYLEIDYINEADNAERFARDFMDVPWVRVPEILREVSTPRVLTMEYLDSFKLTNVEEVDRLGLDRQLLAKRTADAFLRQIVETGYFHCDPHPGNLCVDTKGNLVYYDFGMMDELKPNVKSGFRKFCTALFAGGPTISEAELAKNAKGLVDGVEEAGVLARGADRLAVEKLARYFMRSFKDNQLGKSSANIKQTVGTDLQTLTENNVFRFPSTFTFIFRSFASIDGIGKGLDEKYDIGKLAQPFIEKFTDSQQFTSEAEKSLNIFGKVTGLNAKDINDAVSSPRKVAYIEETVRAMEEGNLKIRVRSMENEKALERMELTQGRMENVLLATAMLNVAALAGPVATAVGGAGAAFFGFQAFMANTKVKKFDKTQAKFVETKFEGDE